MAETTDVYQDVASADAGEEIRTLAGEALEHARELFRAEVALAKLELKTEAKRAALAAALAMFALMLLHAGFLVLIAAIILALSDQAPFVAVVGAVLIVLAAGAAFAAFAAFKRRHLVRTRANLSRDVALLRLRHE